MTESDLILSVNKPIGWTSFDVVNKLRRALRWKAVGHAGTLDPPADGVLIVLCGNATRRSAEFMELRKEYRARIRFGLATNTDDLTGEIISHSGTEGWSRDAIRHAMREFVGEIAQVPPQVSAVKVGGKRSYAAARAGRSLELKPRTVVVYSFDLLTAAEPEIEVNLICARGTYVRAIARDLGARLGWGGTLSRLTRTAVGPYHVEHALTLDSVLKRSREFAPD
ncbi:tRNA pseudouridine(55) synthase TruB [bacterium]|nr:tRNA pseudouridine(55) synthase TruB [bacterium]MBU1984967.1 tRNA pseudouridine(55) synthase TruB [bacterium]